MRPDADGHRTDPFDRTLEDVAGLDRTDPFGGPRHDEITRVERVPLRRPFVEFADVVDQVLVFDFCLVRPLTRSSRSSASGSGISSAVTSHGPMTLYVSIDLRKLRSSLPRMVMSSAIV